MEWVKAFQLELYDAFLNYEDSVDVYPRIFAALIIQHKWMEMANEDTLWAIFSVGFVYLYFIFHLRSLFLATMGILVLMCSFPMAAIINMGVFRNTFY